MRQFAVCVCVRRYVSQRSPSGKDRRSVLFNPVNSAFWKRLAHLLNTERSGECRDLRSFNGSAKWLISRLVKFR